MSTITQNGLSMDSLLLAGTTSNGVQAFAMTYSLEDSESTQGFAATIYRDSNGVTWLDWVATQGAEVYNKGEIILDLSSVSTQEGINPQRLARWIADKLKEALTNNDAF